MGGDHDSSEFESVVGHMFGFSRNGHYRLVLDRKVCTSVVMIPISFGHPSATDKEMSYVLRFVADAPLLITELEDVPRMDSTLTRLFFSARTNMINVNIMGTSRCHGHQGVKRVILDDVEGTRMYSEPLFRVFQIYYLGQNGGVVFVYLAVNDSLIQRTGMKQFSLSLHIEARCRGMMCRTAEGLLPHETIAKAQKFQAAWRKYTCSFDDENRSRLLMVLVQSGVSTEMGKITCEKVATRHGGLVSRGKSGTLNSFLGVSEATDCSYAIKGIFNSVDFEDFAVFRTATSDAIVIDGNIVGDNKMHADCELEKALALSKQEAELQQAIEISVKTDKQQPSRFDQDLEAALIASMSTTSGIGDRSHADAASSSEAEYPYARDLELAMKLSAEVVDVLDSPCGKQSADDRGNNDITNGKTMENDGEDDRKPSPVPPKENKKPKESDSDVDVAEKRRLAAEAALKRFK